MWWSGVGVGLGECLVDGYVVKGCSKVIKGGWGMLHTINCFLHFYLHNPAL